MKTKDDTQLALQKAWHKDSAESSLERWLEVSNKEGWQYDEQLLPLIITIFGASWYFTRFVFYRGPEIFPVLENAREQDFSLESLKEKLTGLSAATDIDELLDELRLVKNEIMLQILVNFLESGSEQQKTEQALTNLAEATLDRSLAICLDNDQAKQHLAVLAMGRMAGGEMNFGSDLDLIFLYQGDSDDIFTILTRQIRIFFRRIALPTSAGLLYEIDTRLRPHGSSGVLVTSYDSFMDYHKKQRDIWERQMMTRCRPVYVQLESQSFNFDEITETIYQEYNKSTVAEEIISMRDTVQEQLGSPTGKYDIKRGKGGIMDIDFITHYLQLVHGHHLSSLRTTSTRKALYAISEHGLLAADVVEFLLKSYDFLKRLEACLRVFDMKAINTISKDAAANVNVARAMGFISEQGQTMAQDFMDEYESLTDQVRSCFNEILNRSEEHSGEEHE